uniref:MFS domain-containing protein n=1 Tax=Steinernema glaseri TaxID=37863 RepID=A0A1I7YXW4_9BILA
MLQTLSLTRSSQGMTAPCSESEVADFGTYQRWLFVITQLGYLPVAGSMLATTFFEPSKIHCDRIRNDSLSPMENAPFESFLFEQDDENFYSLLMHWKLACRQSVIPTFISFFVMFGGVLGAFVAGYLADRFGRKPVVVGTMTALCLGNLLLMALGDSHWALTGVVLGCLGAASGGYMVTNMVLVVEALDKARSRLLVVSMNGWPIGMSFVAICAWLSRHWWTYHLVVAVSAGIFVVVLQTFSLESVRWLVQHNRHVRADKIRLIIDNRNGLSSTPSPCVRFSDAQSSLEPLTTPVGTERPTPPSPRRHYTYVDLFTNRAVRSHLLALLYCFTASSMVSFGIYFNVEALPGNRFVNLLSMGALKFSLGLVPFFVSGWLGRRPIVLLSTGVATLAGWSLVVAWIALRLGNHWLISALSITVTAALDPTWKINHLYSTELFPTVVRNMARAVCNVGARLGGVVAPGIVFLRSTNEVFPYVVFSALLSVQWLVSFAFLPETKDKPLNDVLEENATENSQEDDADRSV